MSDGELMLTTGLKRCEWIPREKQTQIFGRGAKSPVIDLGTPYWEVKFSYSNMTDDEWAELRAWLARRRGALSYFSAFNAMNRTPRGGATSCTVSAGGGGSITVNASPAAQVGDMVAYDDANGGRAVVMLTENTSGNNFNCFPPAVIGSGNPAIVDAAGYFRLIPDSVQMSDPFDAKKSLSFEARQMEPT